MDKFIVVRKRRDYTQTVSNPKISTDAATYQQLVDVAEISGMPISEVARQAIAYAMERLKYVDE